MTWPDRLVAFALIFAFPYVVARAAFTGKARTDRPRRRL